VGERKNTYIFGVAKAMLYDQDLPIFLWEETCNTTIYIQNRSPHKVLGRNTSEEVFTGIRLEIGCFRIFICLVYFHVPSEKMKKLKATVDKGDFRWLQQEFQGIQSLHSFLEEDYGQEGCEV
jgi:hypothetical protein